MERSSAVSQSVALGFAVSLLALASASLGCSSSDEPAPAGAFGDSAGPTSYPNARPCNIKTPYPGDEYCIEAPDPAVGMQLHYGPKDYNNQEEVDRYHPCTPF